MLTVLFLAEKINRWKLFFKSASLHFSHAWKICILEKQVTEVILVGWFGKCQSIKTVGGRRFVEGLYQGARSIQPKFQPVRPGKDGTTSKGGPVFSKLFRLDRTDPLSFGPKFPESLVEWIAPRLSFRFALPAGMLLQSETKIEPDLRLSQTLFYWQGVCGALPETLTQPLPQGFFPYPFSHFFKGKALGTRLTDTSLIWTLYYYGQFALSLRKEGRFIF